MEHTITCLHVWLTSHLKYIPTSRRTIILTMIKHIVKMNEFIFQSMPTWATGPDSDQACDEREPSWIPPLYSYPIKEEAWEMVDIGDFLLGRQTRSLCGRQIPSFNWICVLCVAVLVSWMVSHRTQCMSFGEGRLIFSMKSEQLNMNMCTTLQSEIRTVQKQLKKMISKLRYDTSFTFVIKTFFLFDSKQIWASHDIQFAF